MNINLVLYADKKTLMNDLHYGGLKNMNYELNDISKIELGNNIYYFINLLNETDNKKKIYENLIGELTTEKKKINDIFLYGKNIRKSTEYLFNDFIKDCDITSRTYTLPYLYNEN